MPKSLTRSILATVAAGLIVQAGLFMSFALGFGFVDLYLPAYLATAACFHGLVLGMLLFFRPEFVLEESGLPLDHVNLANKVTLFRIGSLPTLLFLVLAARDYPIRAPLLALVVLVFASDFLDGYISRRSRQATRIGKMMDSASDYSLLVVLSLVFRYFHLIPGWLFALVLARLGAQTVFALVVVVARKRLVQGPTLFGKAAVASIMALYALELLALILPAGTSRLVAYAEYATAAVVAASVVDKAVYFARQLASPPEGGEARS